jgi:hypothetical protein
MSLTLLAIILGLGYALPNAYGLLQPEDFKDRLKKFPRSNTWGYILMLLATAWFVRNLSVEKISDFASYKPIMMIGFTAVGVGCCIYVKDFLAVRGFAVLLLLLAKLTLDTARWVDTEWRLVLSCWAYVWIVLGMWLTISPWRMRDFIKWYTAAELRVKIGSLASTSFGAFVFILAITAFRTAS